MSFFLFSSLQKNEKNEKKKLKKKLEKKNLTSLYSLATSTCISSCGLPLYLSWISLTRGCRACREIVDAICFRVRGYVAAFTKNVKRMMAKP